MKQAIWLIIGGCCSATLLLAEDIPHNKTQQMMGTICNSACVVQQSNLPTCDIDCTDKSGQAVFMSDSGKVEETANSQEMAMPHRGKHTRVTEVPTEKEREESLRIMQLCERGP